MADTVHREVGEVEPGLTLDAIDTVQAADAVLDRLQAGIVRIEQQLARSQHGSVNEPSDWRPRAKAALRAKGFWLPRVQARRAELVRKARQDRQAAGAAAQLARADLKRRHLIRLAWDTEREAMSRVEALARQRFPDLFVSEGGTA